MTRVAGIYGPKSTKLWGQLPQKSNFRQMWSPRRSVPLPIKDLSIDVVVVIEKGGMKPREQAAGETDKVFNKTHIKFYIESGT